MSQISVNHLTFYYEVTISLSNGEQTKVMLAVLFSRDEHFLLIDEPTNHLDAPTREVVREYLKKKKGLFLFHTTEISSTNVLTMCLS